MATKSEHKKIYKILMKESSKISRQISNLIRQRLKLVSKLRKLQNGIRT